MEIWEKIRLFVIVALLAVVPVLTIRNNSSVAKSFDSLSQSSAELSSKLVQLQNDIQTERDARLSADFDLWRGKSVSDDDTALKLINLECSENQNFTINTGLIRNEVTSANFYNNNIQFDFGDVIGSNTIYIYQNITTKEIHCRCWINWTEVPECSDFSEKYIKFKEAIK